MNYPEIILGRIREYKRIIISRHVRPDGDAIGSTQGLKEILRLTFPEKEIYLINEDYSDYLSFLGGEDAQLDDEMYCDALLIVLDTASADRISNRKYLLAKEIIKIDHHIDIKPYGDISWVEDQRSSLCELIVSFYASLRDELKINSYAATCLYTGMVTDSGRFRFNTVTGETLRLASLMLDCGIDTDTLYARLYLEDFDYFRFKSWVYGQMKISEHGVAYLHVTAADVERFSLSFEEACNAVSFLDSIKGSIIWIAFIDAPDGKIRVRLRSRFVTVNGLAEKYHGGGHECASGATVADTAEADALIRDADALIKDYKEKNEGWL